LTNPATRPKEGPEVPQDEHDLPGPEDAPQPDWSPAPAEPEGLRGAWRALVEFLRARGFRVTGSRRSVLRRAMRTGGHFTADQLADEMRTGRDRVSRGTVYRTLALMVEAGLARKTRAHDGVARYECLWGREDHEHLICTRCGRYLEFRQPRLLSSIRRACRKHRFTPTRVRVIVEGLCERCAAADAARR
jgi:Fur family ferric uptake transcriptional regulator